MKVLIDTNVILDVLTKREPHFELSASVLKLCGAQLTGCITANQTADIFYLLRKEIKNAQAVREIIKKLTDHITVLDLSGLDVQNALTNKMNDYEDALLACCAKRQKMDYIVTRNGKDYTLSQIPAVSPEEFIEKYLPMGKI